MDSGSKLKYYDFFVGNLTFTTPLHIGSMDPSSATDAPLLRDANGRIYLPGTSIAGALRAYAAEAFGQDQEGGSLVDLLFGGDKSGMSRFWVEDAYPVEHSYPVLRDGVTIDPRFDAAKPRAKFDLETTPINIAFDLSMRLITRERDPHEKLRSIAFSLLDDFREGKIPLGAGKTRGLGRCKFAFTWHVLDFAKPSDIAAYLIARDVPALPKLQPKPPRHSAYCQPDALQVSIELAVDDAPFLIKGIAEDEDYDACFTTVADMSCAQRAVPFIPGSSVKGVLRARAHKILRTLGGNVCLAPGEPNCSETIKKLIQEKKVEQNNYIQILEHSCAICRLFGHGYLAGRISFPDAFFRGATSPPKKPYDCVAIDRFTGGAASGKLFDLNPIARAEFTIEFLVRKPTDFDRYLVLFLLRDLWKSAGAGGKESGALMPIRVGYGKSKGFGLLKCRGVSINGVAFKAFDASGLKKAVSLSGEPLDRPWWHDDTEE